MAHSLSHISPLRVTQNHRPDLTSSCRVMLHTHSFDTPTPKQLRRPNHWSSWFLFVAVETILGKSKLTSDAVFTENRAVSIHRPQAHLPSWTSLWLISPAAMEAARTRIVSEQWQRGDKCELTGCSSSFSSFRSTICLYLFSWRISYASLCAKQN